MPSPTCPACQIELAERGRGMFCRHCTGLLVKDDVLLAILRQIHRDDVRPLHEMMKRRWPSTRPCPTCGALMGAHELGGVPVDWCTAHGVWFDRDELDHALRGACYEENAEDAEVRQAESDRRSVGTELGFWKWLFRRVAGS